MTCPRCGLPDLRGVLRGDGHTSCDCPRCQLCGAGPDGCSEQCEDQQRAIYGFADEED